ncbi:hypothetical protein UA08_04494 [Talaromyces atroroseus]|uniref:DNA replication regulator Sld3 C-terminal domain-containing protein n=1 Tax=Talaromyces atroroseus TaxID=1441469 RepID=A0A225AFK2_TALAT|nr:hypothetical protein UA08_04494 [Talaromyces atroroseus]OKL60101.1 hypothetical protein UA08_04494 [Talaromyces atroroseus]
MASRGIPAVLETTSLTSLNAINNGPSASFFPPSKRRKVFHDEEDAERSSSTTAAAQTIFSVKGHASSLSDNEFKLAPIELLPRSALPFSWLDTSTVMQSNNIFASNDEALEQTFFAGRAEGDPLNNNEPKVLVTRLLANGAIYVVERVKRGIFAMTKLQSSIEEGEIRVAAKAGAAVSGGSRSRMLRVRNPSDDPSAKWDWREAAWLADDLPGFEPFTMKQSKFEVSVVFKDYNRIKPNVSNNYDAGIDSQISIGNSFMALDSFADPGTQQHVHTPPEDGTQPSRLQPEQDLSSPTPDVIMENLRTQYLEALYISKTSVAYFAKGPLTRCRNAFSQANIDGGDAPSLSSQYRESILSVKKMDAKYRETLPTILRNMTLLLSDEDRPKKRKSRKKKKLGKNGLYSGEDEFLQKYWKSRQMAKNREGEQESKEEEVRRHISELRLRETQLQILLILETIHSESPNIASPAKDSKGLEANGSSTKRSRTKKKEEDLNLLLELLIDRLCIWHAVSAGEGIVPESIKETTDSHLSGKKIESDALRDFCTEVIIPFYGSRLPDQCKTIKKKLGGASEPSPSRPAAPPKLKTSSSSSSSSKAPSGVFDGKKSQLQNRPRRTLQRVLTDERTADSQRARHPSLMRSSTTPALQEVKRESVEPSLPSLGGSVRGGIQVARRADNREVDLNAVAKQHEAKIKKMTTLMEQKKELDAAISALRKPNRELVSKEIADQAEKRTSSSRKPKNPVRNPLGQGVQVMATPRGSRRKDMSGDHSFQSSRHFTARPLAGRTESTTNVEGGASPEMESEIALVPGSAIRPNVLSSTVSSKRKFDSIAETPSRGGHKRSGQNISTTTSIPCSRALFKVPTLPSIPRSNEEHEPESAGATSAAREEVNIMMVGEMTTVTQTPPAKGKTPPSLFFSRQPSATNTVASSSPAPAFETPVKTGVQSTPVKSIYEQLGWDDDDELAL